MPKRPNRWPSGRRFRQRHLRAFRIDQRIGSILLATLVSLAINGIAFWQLYTAKPVLIPRPEPEVVVVTLGAPSPDPEALSNLAPLVPAETGEEAAQPVSSDPRAATDSALAPELASTPATTPQPAARPLPDPAASQVPDPAESRPSDAAAAADTPTTAGASPTPPPTAVVAAEEVEVVSVTLPTPEREAPVIPRDVAEQPAPLGEVLAAADASPDPVATAPARSVDAAPTVIAPAAPVPASTALQTEPEPRVRALPPDAAERLAEALAPAAIELQLPTLPPRSPTEPLRALPPQLRGTLERAPMQEAAPTLTTVEVPTITLPLSPAARDVDIARVMPEQPVLTLAPDAPPPPAARPVPPPSDRALARAEPTEPARPAPTQVPNLTTVRPVAAIPEARPVVVDSPAPPQLRIDAERPAVARPSPPPTRALTPASRERLASRPAAPAIESSAERAPLAIPAPLLPTAMPPRRSDEDVAARPQASTGRPALDRSAAPATRPPAGLNPAAVAATADPGATESASRVGTDADFGLPGSKPGAPGGVDWAASVSEASRDQVADESAARRAARSPWERDEAWFADDPPSRMEQLLRDDPNLARIMVDFLAGALIAGNAQAPRTLYEVGPDPGVLVRLWLDRHHGDLQLACRRDAAAMSEAARRVLCPGERTEMQGFDAAVPPGG